jgi:calcium/calmodulin-dependent protein kinase (CaM kinase) II
MNAAKPTATEEQIIDLTRQLLDTISRGDWETYQTLCDPTLTAFEPEARGQLVAGLDFHRFYFELGSGSSKRANTICSPYVRLLGDDAAVISYVRLVVHFHRSPGT